MDTYKPKWTRVQLGIFRFLCIKSGEEFSLRELSKKLSKSPTAVSKSVKVLEKEDLIKIRKEKKIKLQHIELNRENQRTIELKQTENLKLIYESNLVNFLEKSFPGCTIVLFGSYSKGEDTFSSDIDISIIGSKGKEIDILKYEKKLERKLRVNFFGSIKEINKELKENLFNGIVLSGGIEL